MTLQNDRCRSALRVRSVQAGEICFEKKSDASIGTRETMSFDWRNEVVDGLSRRARVSWG